MNCKSFLCLALVVGCAFCGCSTAPKHPAGLSVRYHNEQYGLTFDLPAAWQGYSVFTKQWDGQKYSPARDEIVTEAQGPIIVLRNPKWTANDPYQDIPIYIFTRRQWDEIHQGKYDAAGAGGMIDELWHDDNYVFGIHSRTFGFNDAVEEWRRTEKIVEQNCAVHPAAHLYPE